MNTHTRSGRAAFTLIELMAVITIIVILAGIVVGGMGYVNEKQARERAKVQIALLSKAIEEYKLDMGAYPGTAYKDSGGNIKGYYGDADASGAGGDYSQVLYTALFYEGYDYSKNPNRSDALGIKATKIYLPELDPSSNKQGWVTSSTTPGASLKIADPWAANYLYRVGANAQNPDFDLWSKGKDAYTDGSKSADYYDANAKKGNRDDIRNF